MITGRGGGGGQGPRTDGRLRALQVLKAVKRRFIFIFISLCKGATKVVSYVTSANFVEKNARNPKAVVSG